MNFDSHAFLDELTQTFEANNNNKDVYAYARSYGALIGFFNVALANLNLSEDQVKRLNTMLQVSKGV